MKKQLSDLKILLLQVRQDKETILEEFYGFVQTGGLVSQQITSINPIHEKNIDWQAVHKYDALFVGGSSDVSVLEPEKYPFIEPCKQLMVTCYEKNIPVFASCFGFQLAVEAFGGKVILDAEHKETGMYQIHCDDNAKTDLLLHDAPKSFWAVSGHKERALTLPENVIPLNYSELCPYHGFKFKDKPFYGFQYHPEMNKADLDARIQRYQNRYDVPNAQLEQILKTATNDTSHANNLVKKFIERVLLV